ncbi:hypothetical protein, partial [Desulfobacter hydrogenophilus]
MNFLLKKLAISLFLMSLSLTTLSAYASEIFAVGPDKLYRTIASALINMKDGDVCIISSGIYREQIVEQNRSAERNANLASYPLMGQSAATIQYPFIFTLSYSIILLS